MKTPGVLLLAVWSVLLSAFMLGCGQVESKTPDPAANQAELVPQAVVAHRLHITLHSEQGELEVVDELDLSELKSTVGTAGKLSFYLNSDFTLQHDKQSVTPVTTQDGVSHYQLDISGQDKLRLSYRGKLASTEDCSWLVQACVLLNDRGVFLDGNSAWYPQIAGTLQRFSMELVLPEGWVSLSQGRNTAQGWEELQPQRDIYLLAGPFQVYEAESKVGQPQAMVYLQSEDTELAERYLQATYRYLDEYSRLLGDYPYAKFATVESFWETGWGMPSFTLLGSRVMRLPFILHSSFPHEILHNWWGNGVYVDSQRGN